MPHFEGLPPPLVPIHFWQKVRGLTPPLCSYIIRNVGSTPPTPEPVGVGDVSTWAELLWIQNMVPWAAHFTWLVHLKSQCLDSVTIPGKWLFEMSITRNINDIEFEGNEVTDSNIKASRGDVIKWITSWSLTGHSYPLQNPWICMKFLKFLKFLLVIPNRF